MKKFFSLFLFVILLASLFTVGISAAVTKSDAEKYITYAGWYAYSGEVTTSPNYDTFFNEICTKCNISREIDFSKVAGDFSLVTEFIDIPDGLVEGTFEAMFGDAKIPETISTDGTCENISKIDGVYRYYLLDWKGSEFPDQKFYTKYYSSTEDGNILKIKVLFGSVRDDGTGKYAVYSASNKNNSSRIVSETFDSIDKALSALESGKYDNQLIIYQHTFEKNSDGTYHYVSTVPVGSNKENPKTSDMSAIFFITASVSAICCFVVVRKKIS